MSLYEKLPGKKVPGLVIAHGPGRRNQGIDLCDWIRRPGPWPGAGAVTGLGAPRQRRGKVIVTAWLWLAPEVLETTKLMTVPNASS